MAVDKVSIGKDAPNDVNVIVEIPAQQIHIKYEIDKDSGELVVDRFMPTPMFMPCHYGYVPHTLGEDGDPIDALIVTDIPVVPRCVVRARGLWLSLKWKMKAAWTRKLSVSPMKNWMPALRTSKPLKTLTGLTVCSVTASAIFTKTTKPLSLASG